MKRFEDIELGSSKTQIDKVFKNNKFKKETFPWKTHSWVIAINYPELFDPELFNWKKYSWAVIHFYPEAFDKDKAIWDQITTRMVIEKLPSKFCPEKINWKELSPILAEYPKFVDPNLFDWENNYMKLVRLKSPLIKKYPEFMYWKGLVTRTIYYSCPELLDPERMDGVFLRSENPELKRFSNKEIIKYALSKRI